MLPPVMSSLSTINLTGSLLLALFLICLRDATHASSFARIVGGTQANIIDFPFLAYIRIQRPSTQRNKSCSGSYIHKRWILTAAHCMLRYPNELIHIYMGDSSRKHLDGPNMQYRLASVVVPHPRHLNKNVTRDGRKVGFDLGLLHIEEPFKYTDSVQLGVLPEKWMNYSGLEVTIVGWGRLDPTDVKRPDILQRLDTVVWKDNHYKCTSVPNNPICVGSAGKHGSVGDSGGPLIYNRTIIGVLSHGSSWKTGAKTVFENVYEHQQWIKNTIMLNVRASAVRKDGQLQLIFILSVGYFLYTLIQKL